MKQNRGDCEGFARPSLWCMLENGRCQHPDHQELCQSYHSARAVTTSANFNRTAHQRLMDRIRQRNHRHPNWLQLFFDAGGCCSECEGITQLEIHSSEGKCRVLCCECHHKADPKYNTRMTGGQINYYLDDIDTLRELGWIKQEGDKVELCIPWGRHPNQRKCSTTTGEPSSSSGS